MTELSPIWQFLNEKQRYLITSLAKQLSERIKLPVPLHQIYHQISMIELPLSVQKIDPKGNSLAFKVIQMNELAVKESLMKISDRLTDEIEQTLQTFKKQHTIHYLGWKILKLINQECKCSQFKWKIPIMRNGSLWQRLYGEVSHLLQDIIIFMVKHFQFSNFPIQLELNILLQRFRNRMQNSRQRLLFINPIEQRLSQSLLKVEVQQRQKSKIVQKSVVVQLLSHVQKIQQINHQNQILQAINSSSEVSNEQLKKSQKEIKKKLKQQKIKQQEGGMLSYLRQLKDGIVNKIVGLFELQILIPKKQPSEKDIKNVENLPVLKEQQIKIINQLSQLNYQNLIKNCTGKFSADQKAKIEYYLKNLQSQWLKQQILVSGEGQLVQSNRLHLLKFQQYLLKTLNYLQPGKGLHQNRYFILVSLFYRTLQRRYTTLTKKYLIKICQTLEDVFKPCPYLRGALKILEKNTLKPSVGAEQLQKQLPYRSQSFQVSEQSRMSKELLFPDIKQKQQKEKVQLQQFQTIKFKRLNYSKPSKNVIFLVSGFLEENTQKDREWLGVIRSLYDSQLYGVVWRSSTKLQLGKYIALGVAKLALKGITGIAEGIMNAIASVGMKLANLVFQKGNGQQNNPFWEAFARASEAGKELANQIMEHFSDRHITLVGFSMGTQVIRCCLGRLKHKKKLHLVHKVVTFGGFSDRESVNKLLQRCQNPITWINFESQNDYTVRYIYRVCSLGDKPIGSGGLRPVEGHEIVNWDVSKVVESHINFREHLFGLCLLAGLRHD